jgi:hypothetical protein
MMNIILTKNCHPDGSIDIIPAVARAPPRPRLEPRCGTQVDG